MAGVTAPPDRAGVTAPPDPAGVTAPPVRTGSAGRRRVALLVAALTLCWGYAAFLTARDAADLLRVRTLSTSLGQPTDALILSLQTERRLTAAALAEPGARPATLAAQRADTDAAIAKLRAFNTGTDLRLAGAQEVRDRAAELIRRLDTLDPLRRSVDAGGLDREQATTAYTEMIDAGFAVYAGQWTSRETRLIEQTRSFVALARAREVLAREDTLLTGALTARRVTSADRARLADLVAAQRFVRAEAAAALPPPERDRYRTLVGGDGLTALRALEDQLAAPGDDAEEIPAIPPQVWRAAVEPVLADLRDLVAAGVRDSVERATPATVSVVVRTGLVGGLGFIVVMAAIVGALGATRRPARRPVDQTDPPESIQPPHPSDHTPAAGQTPAPDQTPAAGQPHPGDQNRPLDRNRPLVRTGPGDQLRPGDRQVGDGSPSGASRLARDDLFLQLSRRNQVLLRQQLTLLDAMERRETDAEELADLFRVDHLTTRIRRNVERLITAAGARPARRWRRPVPLIDVVRGAAGEVAEYERVLVSSAWAGSLAGPAVLDLTHLLAELIENALDCSPPDSTVRVSVQFRDHGCLIVVLDDGPGLAPEALAGVNSLLREPPPVRPPGAGHGLHGAALAAGRWNVRVELAPGHRGGTAARVLIPAALLAGPGGPGGEQATMELPAVDPQGPPDGPADGPVPEPAPQPAAAGPTRRTGPAARITLPNRRRPQ
jgi:hypothetical protein